MFGLSGTEIAVILLVALIVFGPKQLPRLAHRLGKTLRELRQASQELKSGLESDLLRDDRATTDVSPKARTATPATEASAANEAETPPREATARPDTHGDGHSQVEARAALTDESEALPADASAKASRADIAPAVATSGAALASHACSDAANETVHLAASTGDVPQAARDLRRPDAGI